MSDLPGSSRQIESSLGDESELGWSRTREKAFELGTEGEAVGEAKLLEEITNAIRAEVERTKNVIITADSRLVEDLDLDSIDIVAVTIRLEDRFHVSIDVQKVKELRYVSDLMDQMTNLLGKSAA